jgi:gliding motility-associated-like protein
MNRNKFIKISTGICFMLLLSSFYVKSQTFWTEPFTNGCTAACLASSYTTGPNGAWTLTSTGTNDAEANEWFISCAENGNAVGACGSGCGNNATLHVGANDGMTVTDGGASYDAGGLCPTLFCVATDMRAESPTINCTGHSTITLAFQYMEDGDGTNDDATLWYYNGSIWAQIDPLAKTPFGACAPQGKWASFSIVLPASADNNPNVKIGFRWVNNDDGVGSDPSFAVDNVTLSTASAGPLPVAAFSINDSTICVGSCINFTDLTTNTPTSWAWTFPNGTPGTSAIPNPTGICFNVAGTYPVTLIATNANGSDTATVNVIVTAIPVVTVNPNPVTLCSGSSVLLTASGGTTYTWAPALGLSATTGSSVTANPTTNTTYSVTGTTNGCTGSTTVVVTISPTLSLTINPNASTICTGASDTIIVSGATTYSWSPSAGLNTTVGDTVIVNPTVTTTYTVTGTQGGCTGTATIVVTVTPGITAEAGPDVSICIGDSMQLNASGGSTYAWSPATGLSCTNCANPYANPTTTTTYTVTVSSGACVPGTDQVTVTISPPPIALITCADTSICFGATTVLTASGGNTYLWSNSATTASITVSPPFSMNYSVTVSNGGTCTDDAVIHINVDPQPTVTAYSDTTITIGASVQLTATGAVTYIWAPSNELSCESCQSPVATPTSTTVYTVTGTDANGCTNTTTVVVTVIMDCGEIFIPKGFSPNADGYNDILYVRGNCIKFMEFSVYDRWGERVYFGNDPLQGWNGSYKGKKMNSAVFVYYLRATLFDNTIVIRQGNISLIR